MRNLALTVAAGAILLGTTSRVRAASYAPKVGERHPDFTLPTIDDHTPASLSDFRTKFNNCHSWASCTRTKQ